MGFLRGDLSNIRNGLLRYKERIDAVVDRSFQRTAAATPSLVRDALLANDIRMRRALPATVRRRRGPLHTTLADFGVYANSYRSERVPGAIPTLASGATGMNGRVPNDKLALMLEHGTRRMAPFRHTQAIARLIGRHFWVVFLEEARRELHRGT